MKRKIKRFIDEKLDLNDFARLIMSCDLATRNETIEKIIDEFREWNAYDLKRGSQQNLINKPADIHCPYCKILHVKRFDVGGAELKQRLRGTETCHDCKNDFDVVLYVDSSGIRLERVQCGSGHRLETKRKGVYFCENCSSVCFEDELTKLDKINA